MTDRLGFGPLPSYGNGVTPILFKAECRFLLKERDEVLGIREGAFNNIRGLLE